MPYEILHNEEVSCGGFYFYPYLSIIDFMSWTVNQRVSYIDGYWNLVESSVRLLYWSPGFFSKIAVLITQGIRYLFLREPWIRQFILIYNGIGFYLVYYSEDSNQNGMSLFAYVQFHKNSIWRTSSRIWPVFWPEMLTCWIPGQFSEHHHCPHVST